MNDDFLNKFRKEPRHEFASALYQRINKPMQTQSKHPAMRFGVLALSVVILLLAVFMLWPSTLVFAEGIIRQVGGYIFVEGDQPINVRKAPSPVQVYKTQDSVSLEASSDVSSAHDPGEASQLAGFSVLAPQYLPDGFTAMSAWLVGTEDGNKVVTIGYRDAANRFFLINQGKFSKNASQRYARSEIVDVTVRGHAGVWLPGGKNALVWQENGITYWLITDSVPLDELLKVAESLGQ